MDTTELTVPASPRPKRLRPRRLRPAHGSDPEAGAAAAVEPARRWRHSWLNTAVSLLLLAGLTLLLYPAAASWVSQRNQSNIVFDQTKANEDLAKQQIDDMIAEAHEYNAALESGALLAGGANVAEGTGESMLETMDPANYWDILNAEPNGVLARIRIPAINLDLPVYHGTSDATLLKGVGHLQGTSLPVGGEGTRSVLTGHRGLANAKMFTHLNRVEVGDTFTVEVLGKTYAYEVFETQVVEPHETEEIRAVPGKDLMTLITCTPLGVNTHRILVTGERIDPTPKPDLDQANARPEVPGFPWWAVAFGAGLIVIGVWEWRSGYGPRRKASPETDSGPEPHTEAADAQHAATTAAEAAHARVE